MDAAVVIRLRHGQDFSRSLGRLQAVKSDAVVGGEQNQVGLPGLAGVPGGLPQIHRRGAGEEALGHRDGPAVDLVPSSLELGLFAPPLRKLENRDAPLPDESNVVLRGAEQHLAHLEEGRVDAEQRLKLPAVLTLRRVQLAQITLLELNFLPTSGPALTKQQLILARDVLEIGALWSILKKDIPSFERYMAQLKCYYFDYKEELPDAAYMHQLLGLNLLFLLSQNRLSEFHTELERLSGRDIQTNVYIRHPVSLEQYLMEGSYNKVFLAKGNIPAESYTFFIDILLDTIRDEIAGCIEKAYEQIQFTEATRVLFFNSPKKMTEFAKKRGWTQTPDGCYSFTTQQQRTEEVTIPSTELAQQVIEYARQLEMIV